MTNELQAGGTERQFALVAKSLPRGSFDVELACLNRRGTFLEGLGDIAEFTLGGGFFTLKAQRARSALVRHLRTKKVDLAHAFDFYSNLMLIPAARLAGVPVLLGSQRQLGDLLNPWKRVALRWTFRLCDRVVCNSRAAAERLVIEGLPRSRVIVIPNALEAEAFAEVAPALPPVPGVQRVGLIGRMNNPVKNQSLFLRAAAKLAPKFPRAEFVLVGDGRLRPGLEREARELGIRDRVMFLGQRMDIPAVLASLDISVVPSLSESLSNVILESMAAGKPVIASRVGGNPELVQDGETGLLFPREREDKLVEALEFLLARPERVSEWGQQAKQQARKRFNLTSVLKQFEELYVRLLEEKTRRPAGTPAARRLAGACAQPFRIAIVGPSLRKVGGQAVQADLLFRQWKNDPKVEAHFIPIDPVLPAWIAWAGRIPVLRTILRTPVFLWELVHAAREVDIFHIFSASYWSFLLAAAPAWLVARLFGKKALINYRSGEARDHLQNWSTATALLRRADRLVVPSGYLLNVFREHGLSAQIVPNIVDLEQFSFRVRRPLHPRLICTRGFEPYYSVDLVVRAFAEVKRAIPQAQLCLLGTGSLEPQVRAIVQELCLDNVEFRGAVSRNRIGSFYDSADIFINASWLDNMPGSILEAFASGTAVVSTAPEGIRYIVTHEQTGLLCEPGDWRALAKNVFRLLREQELAQQIIRNAYEESRRYRWDAVRSQWLEVYNSILKPSSQPKAGTTAGDDSGPSVPQNEELKTLDR